MEVPYWALETARAMGKYVYASAKMQATADPKATRGGNGRHQCNPGNGRGNNPEARSRIDCGGCANPGKQGPEGFSELSRSCELHEICEGSLY